jgi:hypothetical protein
MNPHIATGTNEKSHNRKEANNTVNKQAKTWHDAQPSMMHGMAKCNKQHYKLSEIQYATR